MIDIINPMIKKFLPFAKEKMGFSEPPKLFLKGSSENANDPLGKTAFYDPQAKSITVFITGRHPKDVMRSLSHELVHHTQNCRGEFKNTGEMGEGYAQNDEHLREMEREAYEIGNMCFRDWEDSIKSTIYFEHLQKGVNKTMSIKDWKNGEISTLLSEAWGFKFNSLQEFDEFNGTGEIQEESTDAEEVVEEEELEERTKRDSRDRVAGRDSGGRRVKPLEEEEEIEEAYANAKYSDPRDRRKPVTSKDKKSSRYADEERAAEKEDREEKKKKAVSEAQIREVAMRVIKRLKETKKNG